MKFINTFLIFILVLVVAVFDTRAQTAPTLGAAARFAVLGASTVTNTGPTVITGDVGVSPGSAITGFPPAVIISGTTYTEVASLAGPAQTAAKSAFDQITAMTVPAGNDLTGKVLGQTAGAVILEPGVYFFSSSAQLNNTLTLNDHGDPNAVFIFKIGSTLTTATSAKVIMSSGGKGPNVYWQIGSSATIGTYTTFAGNIIATASITMTTGATTTGRLIALTAAVTMDTNTAYAVSAVPVVIDTDGDGVADALDDYPNDRNKAYNTFTTPGSVAFEDQWPVTGDFDLNDLIMAAKYTIVTNAQNNVVQVIGNFTMSASGGNLENGYGVEFPIPAADVLNLTGAVLEPGQAKAVVVLFTNMHTEMATGNTEPGAPISPSKNYVISFDVANGPSLVTFGQDYNPFIFSKVGSSRHEVHLVGKTPTSLADKTLFGTSDDNTSVALGRYYVTKTGLPYAISLPESAFKYPAEGKDVTKAYLHFVEWAQSGGTLFTDWYSNELAGYRNNALIFLK